jgi:uncharacterized protein (DUF58 family)
MLPPLRIALADRQPMSPEEAKKSRERTLEAMRKYREAQAELERICKEKGIEVPILVCAA